MYISCRGSLAGRAWGFAGVDARDACGRGGSWCGLQGVRGFAGGPSDLVLRPQFGCAAEAGEAPAGEETRTRNEKGWVGGAAAQILPAPPPDSGKIGPSIFPELSSPHGCPEDWP